MKKIMFILVAVAAFTVTSCSKESQINKKLEGSWNAVSVDNVAPQSGTTYTVVFSKSEKTTGTGTTSYSSPSLSYSYPFTYTLAEDKMTVVTTIGSSTSTDVVTINVYEKDKIQWTNADGEVTVLEPK